MDADELQAGRELVIAGFRPLSRDDVAFDPFEVYTETEGGATDSTTDTFVTARLWIDTHRWRGLPFLLRTGR